MSLLNKARNIADGQSAKFQQDDQPLPRLRKVVNKLWRQSSTAVINKIVKKTNVVEMVDREQQKSLVKRSCDKIASKELIFLVDLAYRYPDMNETFYRDLTKLIIGEAETCDLFKSEPSQSKRFDATSARALLKQKTGLSEGQNKAKITYLFDTYVELNVSEAYQNKIDKCGGYI